MANKLQIKRGLKSSLPTLDNGEPGFCTDTGELYVGDGTTNYRFIPGDQEVKTTSDVQFNNITATGTIDAGSNKIINVSNPINPTDAVNLQSMENSSALNWTVISSNTTASKARGYLVDCSSSAITLTLPASPSEGDVVGVSDFTKSAGTNAITIAGNGENIEGAAEDLVTDISGAGFSLVYSNATQGWKIVSEIPNRYTDEEAQDAVGNIISGDNDISVVYDDSNNSIDIGIMGLSQFSTDDLSEGSNLYFTTGRIDSHLSGGTGIDYSNGNISIDSTVTQNTDTNVSGNSWVLDEVDLSSNSSTKVPTQRSVKSYVDALEQGLDPKDSVRASTNGTNIDLTSSIDPNPIDGVTLSDGDRILLKDQTDAAENGIYVANTASNPSTWERTPDADSDMTITPGMFTFVEEGTNNNNKGFVLTTNGTITVGTTELNFSQFSGAGQITAGQGLTKSGDTLNVNLDIEDNGTNVGTGYGLSFNNNISVSDDGDGTFSINVPHDLTVMSNYSTDDLSEGSNLYFTTGRIDDHLSGGTGINYSAGTISTDDANINHDSLSNFVANEHIDHSNISISGGTGLSGGGDLTSSRTINLNASATNLNDIASASESDRHVLVYNSTNTQYENRLLTEADISDLSHYTSSDFDTDFGNKTTTDLTEGNNLYFTTARVDSHLSGGTGISYSSGSIAIDAVINNINDVSISSVLDTDLLQYNSDNSQWENVNGIDANKITTGSFADARINKSSVTQYSYSYSDLSLGIDDSAVNGQTSQPISSNWAYDHTNADTGVHGAGSNTLLHSASTIDCGAF